MRSLACQATSTTLPITTVVATVVAGVIATAVGTVVARVVATVVATVAVVVTAVGAPVLSACELYCSSKPYVAQAREQLRLLDFR